MFLKVFQKSENQQIWIMEANSLYRESLCYKNKFPSFFYLF